MRRGGPSAASTDTKLYELLGVEKTADEASIKKAFRKAALQHHPDRGGNADTFKEVNKAYEVLSDPEKRKIYDQYGEEGLKEGGGGGVDPSDIFSQFFGGGFGGGGGRQQRKPTKTPDVQHQLALSLQDFYRGRTKKLKVQRQVLCKTCSGKGSQKEGATQTCTGCRGQGIRMVMHRIVREQHITCVVPARF
jgi:DnaJ family protein A protein 2